MLFQLITGLKPVSTLLKRKLSVASISRYYEILRNTTQNGKNMNLCSCNITNYFVKYLEIPSPPNFISFLTVFCSRMNDWITG